jgi:CDGSH-type Zn-finger protein
MKPEIAQKSPYSVEVESGKSYYWCSCGKSKNQPFCDGSHQGSEFTPVVYTATESKTVYFCGCKKSGNKPMCDGSHSKL